MNLLEFTWFNVSGLETTEPQLGFVISQKLMGHGVSKKDKPDKLIFEVYQKFFLNKSRKSGWRQSCSEEANGSRSWWWSGKWDEKNHLLFLLHTFWLYCLLLILPKIISSVVHIKKGMPHVSFKETAIFISLTFQLFLLFCILERYLYIGPFLKYLAPKNGL